MEAGQDQPVVVADNGSNPLAGSFEARMQERRTEREQRTTEIFEPAGFEDLFRVEMQTLGYKRIADIADQNIRHRDDALRALYTNSDLVMAATVAFYKVMDDDSLDLIEDGSWLAIARVMYPELDQMTKPRVALIRLLEGVGVSRLANEWMEWNTRGNQQVDKELRLDFSGTG